MTSTWSRLLLAPDRCLYPGDAGIEHGWVVNVAFIDPMNNQDLTSDEDLCGFL
jgi:hypothetical protein